VKEYGVYTGRNPMIGKFVDVKTEKVAAVKIGQELNKRVDRAG
jgi:nucleoid DNA-binding protein